MLTASLVSTLLCLASPSTEPAPARNHQVLLATRDDGPQGVSGVIGKGSRPILWGIVATVGGVAAGLTATGLALGGVVLMAVGYSRAEGVPNKGVADFSGKLDTDDLVNGVLFDGGKYGIIAAIFLGGFALIITGAGLGLLVASLIVRE